MMRTWRWTGLVLALFATACGGDNGSGNGDGGPPESAACKQARKDYTSFVAAHQSCTSDGDCIWMADGCFTDPLCDSYVDIGGLVEATQKLTAGQKMCMCVTCSAQQAACNNGVCGPKM